MDEIFPTRVAVVFADTESRSTSVRHHRRYYAGVVHVPAGTEYTHHYETAAWYKIVTTTEDRWYPVFAVKSDRFPYDYSLTATVEATVTSAYFPSLFGGVAYGSEPQGTRHRDVGAVETFRYRVSPAMFDDGSFLPVTLGFSAVRSFYQQGDPRFDKQFRYNDQSGWRPFYDKSLDKAELLEGLRFSKYGVLEVE